MVILSLSPLHVGIESVIGGTAFVLVLQPLLRRSIPLSINLYDSFCPESHIRMDKDLQTICRIPQDIVCAAANNDTGFLLGKLCNDLILDFP